MFKFVILVSLMPLLAFPLRADFPDNEEYGPITRPTNPTKARDLLGYDTFQKTSQNFNNVRFGNNWEQYETPELKYNPEFRPTNYREERREFSRDRYHKDDRDRDYGYRRDSYRDYRRNY